MNSRDFELETRSALQSAGKPIEVEAGANFKH